MSSGFDPYYKWLGIPPKDQPPHHYRLLGIELFESDREVIDAAANRLMSFLQEQSAGEEMDAAQKLLNEIAAARVCLLNAGKRDAYDKQLKAKLNPPSTPAAVPRAQPVQGGETPPTAKLARPAGGSASAPRAKQVRKASPPPPPDPATPLIDTEASAAKTSSRATSNRSASNRGTRGRGYQRKKSNLLPILVLGGCTIAAGCVLAVVLLSPDKTPPIQSASSGEGGQSTANKTAATLRIDLGDAARHQVRFYIDSRVRQLPATGAIEFDLHEGAHDLTIERDGFEPVQQRVATVNNVITDFKVEWRAKNKNPDALEVKKSFNNLGPPPKIGSAAPAALIQELPGMIGYWSFDEDLVDRGGKNFHAVLEGHQVTGGVLGGAAAIPAERVLKVSKPIRKFDGGMGAAVAGWFRWSEGGGPILAGPKWRVAIDGDRLVLAAGEKTIPAKTPLAELRGRWTHLAVIHQKGQQRMLLLVNGVTAAQTPIPNPAALGQIGPLEVRCPGGGAVDELAAFGRPLPIAKVKALVAAAPKPADSEPDEAK